MTTFQKGDRVIYTGDGGVRVTKDRIGHVGTITDKPTATGAAVRFDHPYPASAANGEASVLLGNLRLLTHQEALQYLRPGQRVRVMRKAEYKEQGWPAVWTPAMDRMVGKEAVIHAVSDPIGVLFTPSGAYFPAHVLMPLDFPEQEKAMPSKKKYEFFKGQRVVYTGTDKRMGLIGYVQQDMQTDNRHATVEVQFTGKPVSYEVFVDNVRPAPDTPKADIEAALELLRQNGTVEFKPFKPPFQNIDVQLNSAYSALVKEDRVEVGCQSFTLDAIEALAAAVKKAREYSNGT